MLYDEFIEGDRLKEIQSFYDTILRMSLDETQSVENKKAIASILESVRSKKGIKKEDVARVLHLSVDSDEFSKIFGKNLKNVGKTFPGVELVHFVRMMLIVKCGMDMVYLRIWEQLYFGIL